MIQLNFLLPNSLQSWIDQLVAEGQYADAGDYLRDLIRRDRAKAQDIARVRALIEEGEASGFIDADPNTLIEEMIAKRRARRT